MMRIIVLAALAGLSGCGGGDGGLGKAIGSAFNGVQTTIQCQLIPPSGEIWTTPFEIGPNIYGTWSAATLDDRSTLVLRQEQSVDPNQLTLVRYDCRGRQIESRLVASRPAPVGDISRPTLYSPVLRTDGRDAWVLWRQFEPNANNSDEVETAHVRRWTPDAEMSDTLAILPRYNGSITAAEIDVGSDGSAIVAWLESVPNAPIPVHFGPKLAAVMTWAQASGWTAPVNLVEPNPAPGADIDRITASTPRSGQAAVAWVRQRGQIVEGVQLTGAGKWSPPEEIFRDDALGASLITPLDPSALEWKVVMDQSGSTTAIWAWRSSDGNKRGLSYNHNNGSAGWSKPQLIAPLGTEATMSVSIARNGFGAVAWRAGYDVAAAWFDQDGFLGGTYLTYAEPLMGYAHRPEIVVDAEGHIVAVWAEQFWGAPNGALEVARGARYSPQSGWSPNVTLSTDESPTRPVKAANSAAGIGSVIWIHGDLSGGPPRAGTWLAPFSMSLR